MPTVTDASPLKILLAAMKSLVRWFKAAKVRGVIIGGVASTLLGRPRMTRDVDGMVWLGDDDRTADFIALAARFGIVPRIEDAVAFARTNRVMLLTHPASAIHIDVSSGCLPFEEELLDRSRIDSSLGFDVPLPSPEDLIVMKLLPSRPHDLSDIEGILDVHPDLDVARVRLWAHRFAEVAEMPEIAENFERLLVIRDRLRSRADKLRHDGAIDHHRSPAEQLIKPARAAKKRQSGLATKKKTPLKPESTARPFLEKSATAKKVSAKKAVAKKNTTRSATKPPRQI